MAEEVGIFRISDNQFTAARADEICIFSIVYAYVWREISHRGIPYMRSSTLVCQSARLCRHVRHIK